MEERDASQDVEEVQMPDDSIEDLETDDEVKGGAIEVDGVVIKQIQEVPGATGVRAFGTKP